MKKPAHIHANSITRIVRAIAFGRIKVIRGLVTAGQFNCSGLVTDHFKNYTFHWFSSSGAHGTLTAAGEVNSLKN